MSNQHSSCRQQSACLLEVTFALCLMSFFILYHLRSDSYGLFYFENQLMFFPLLTGSVLLCWFTITFFPPNVLALSHSHIFGDQYHTTTWLKTVNGHSWLLPSLNYCRPIILTTHNLLLITPQKSVNPIKNNLNLLLVYLPLWTQGYLSLVAPAGGRQCTIAAYLHFPLVECSLLLNLSLS